MKGLSRILQMFKPVSDTKTEWIAANEYVPQDGMFVKVVTASGLQCRALYHSWEEGFYLAERPEHRLANVVWWKELK